ncbi:MAG TPA: hypothetical protein VMJ10_31785 [Kofleriaceae bacterium]|nr:hypothetical protein [Kofleriaceae bacterium]
MILGPLLARIRENLRGHVELDEHAGALVGLLVELCGEERGAIAAARGRLHVVRDDHDRERLLELAHQVLDARRVPQPGPIEG